MHDLLLLVLAVVSTANATPAKAPVAAGPMPEASGLEADPTPGAGRGGAPGNVLVVGDSLAVGTKPYVERGLPASNVETSAFIGRHADDGVAEITGRPSLPPVLVVSLGTNDDPSAVSTFSGQVQEVLDAAGPRGCVVWPNIVRPPYNGVAYAGYNRALARISAADPRLIVVDWVSMTAANPGWMAPDGVHASSEGYSTRGAAIVQAVKGCAGGAPLPGASGPIGD